MQCRRACLPPASNCVAMGGLGAGGRALGFAMPEWSVGGMENSNKNNNFGQGIVELYDRIVDRVVALEEETRQTVEGFKRERGELQEKLKGKLAQGESLRKKDFDLLIRDIIEKRKQREADVVRMIERFKKEEEEMASGLRQLLDKGKEIRIKDFKRVLAKVRARQEERSSEVEEVAEAASRIRKEAANVLEGFKKGREEMTAEWQKLAAIMQKKRATKGR